MPIPTISPGGPRRCWRPQEGSTRRWSPTGPWRRGCGGSGRTGPGLAAVGLAKPAHAGWEDAAVPPEALGAYLRDFDALLAAHGLHGLPYGHFGEGCVHVRIDFELSSPNGVAGYRSFVEAAAQLAAGYGGSCSGEHGDGRARSELLGRMYSSQALALFAAVKHIFDPDNLLNPGVLVDPRPLDADLRLPAAAGSRLPRLDVGFAAAAHRCTGVGKCLADTGGVMCPSYQATGREQDSTRGRARVLQEMVNGTLVTGGWRAPQVQEALDLCLSCKACASECPTGTDVAALKSRVLAEVYRFRPRPPQPLHARLAAHLGTPGHRRAGARRRRERPARRSGHRAGRHLARRGGRTSGAAAVQPEGSPIR